MDARFSLASRRRRVESDTPASDETGRTFAARETLAPELTGRHENANCHASPDGEATLRRPAPQRLDSYAGVMDTARAARHRSSRVGRRAETRPNPRGASRKRRQKGDGGTFGPAFSPIIDPPQAPEIMEAKPNSALPTHTANVTPTTPGAGCSSGQCTTDRQSRSHVGFRPSEWRDPDSNRGHHDFQSCALPTELSRQRAKEG